MKLLSLLASLAVAVVVAAQPNDPVARRPAARGLVDRILLNNNFPPSTPAVEAVLVPPPSLLDAYQQGKLPAGGLVILGHNDQWFILNPDGVGLSLSALSTSRPATPASDRLKSPAEVAQAWQDTMDQARQPTPLPKSLRDPARLEPGPAPTFTPENRPLTAPAPRVRSQPFPFKPNDLINKDYQPPALPPDARPWAYRGQTFWLIPLGDAAPDGGVAYRLVPADPSGRNLPK
jgi:hypothetical protein